MKTLLKEFKAFAVKGNVIDLAVGVIIGGAFGKIVSSIVNDLIMPPIGLLLGGMSFVDLYINLNDIDESGTMSLAQAQQNGIPVIAYGQFINVVLDFLIVAASVFLMVKLISKLPKRVEEEKPAAPAEKECPYCLSSVPIKATRCKHCTSHLEPSVDGGTAI
ncbi:large conductance mechanosensitive channel [Paenibacillus cellulosilyticus]|uniref:Large-conductance mechanosensitive channel n=1 Tax=Paenibacillus cellulosilyticus TaxID=375489 RepID=A0A2V2YEN0_9BACL|nr:large conductance mechanosensitive channel protein MscL [Paenibacillus cellulosilyticus]PWV90649.1 large conductance mechanosensitive channel [Paenibacillus cellulosilyticus]QKS43929.1 large conductance mechanosensitive channel protein MscL [Paenibacillus cellulosilyticus]